MKGLIFMYGETFRKGNQNNRNIGSAAAYEEQFDAVKTHIKLIDMLHQKHNCICDVIISTYTTKYIDELIDMYNENVTGTVSVHQHNNNHVHFAHHDLMPSTQQYDFVFHMRPDLYFKDLFIENIFNPHWNKIYFPSVCFLIENYHITGLGNPRINDTMMFVPRRFHMFNVNKVEHCYLDLLLKHIPIHEIGFMVDEHYDSDSFKDRNPMYRIVNRSESNNTQTHSSIKIYDTFPILRFNSL